MNALSAPLHRFALREWLRSEVRVVGSFSFARLGRCDEFAAALELLAQNPEHFERVVTDVVALSALVEARERATGSVGDRGLKVVMAAEAGMNEWHEWHENDRRRIRIIEGGSR